MRQIKKTLAPFMALLLAFVMLFSVTACKVDGGGDTDDNGQTQTPDDGKPDDGKPDDEKPGGDVTPDAIISSGAYNESLYVVFKDNSPTDVKVEYSLAGGNSWHTVDAPLIRAISGTQARVDILGLAAGSYNVKITLSSGGALQLPSPIRVDAYDRSGYAHFNYADGVGAYNDDGTLKDGTLVIYVTDENKNDVLDFAYVDGKKVDISQYMVATQTATEGGVTVGQQTGIGEMLNNRRYSGNDRWNTGISKLCEVYGSVAIRIIGTVSAEVSGSMDSSIKGLTTYNSKENGGSTGDNGRMARMVNAHDLTVEGVGDDASMYGWGIHFISSHYSNKTARMGKGFEVRNLTFQNYPEDAVGMEGEQGILSSSGSVSGSSSASSDLYSPVERCWIHNNTFLPGFASNPAESDKKEGDGSCDFKRGEYYTLSYNYFEYCHKTNLIGSGDTSLQYNITFHHNWWNQCGSRIPLLRRANIHFYNNYVSGDQTDEKAALSYVTSVRGEAYMFSEANYFDGCKTISEVKSGAVKSYNDVIYADFKGNASTTVDSRDALVANNCGFIYRKIDYSHFDTNPEQFYFKDGASDCLLDDAVTARKNAMMFSGANGRGVTKTDMNTYTPTKAVTVAAGGTPIALPTSKGDSEVNGVLFRAITGVSSGTIKYKGQGITFTLTAQAQLTVTTSTTEDSAPELVGADGAVYAHKFTGTLTVVLEAGTYFIASGQKDKEVNISAMKFEDTAESSAARIEAAQKALQALPANAALTEDFATALQAAKNAYGALTAEEKATFDSTHSALVAKLTAAESEYGNLLVSRARELINAIGTVTANSYEKIKAAQDAYDALTAAQKAQLTAQKAQLDAAWAEYDKFAVQNVIDLINAFETKVAGVTAASDKATVAALLKEAEAIQAAYDLLSSDAEDEGAPSQKAQVTNLAKLTAAIEKLQTINNLYEFVEQLEALSGRTITSSDGMDVVQLISAYEALTAEQKAALTAEQKSEYDRIVAEYEEIMQATITCDFSNAGKPSDTTGVFATEGSQKSSPLTVMGVEYKKGLKLDSNGKLTVNVQVKCMLTLYVLTDKTLKVDGVETAAPTASTSADTQGYVITIELEAGVHTITKGNGENSLYFAVLTPM